MTTEPESEPGTPPGTPLRVRTPAGVLAYQETGTGEPLIMHHGAESHRGQYTGFARHLPGGIRAISYDQRDIGDSFTASGPYSMGDLADDCVALMDALGIDRAHVMGISFGGALSLHVAIRHPDRVRSLLVGAAPDGASSPSEFMTRLLSATDDERTELMIEAVLSDAGRRDPALAGPVRRIVSGRHSPPGSPRMAALAGHRVVDDLHRITAPTVLFYGADDPLVPVGNGEVLAAGIAGAELVVVPGARHGLSFEFATTVATLVGEFVHAHPVTGPAAAPPTDPNITRSDR
ncbi:alpha/beta hydrolase [Pseudonocardia kongjuensis]|uniref:Alpha/beta hydrolase n=1 Tax=Pseudonocardia kongjuensis TaxID=102227 RepID=A0ABN1XHI4_9PSEU